MKSLNEAYRVLRNKESRRVYDAQRIRRSPHVAVSPKASPTAQDIGLYGHGLSALLCLLAGLFVLFLVRIQWMFFLWPLLIVAVLVILFGILMARNAMRAVNTSLPLSNRFRRYTRLQEVLFWIAVLVSGYGVYLLLTAI